jgi:YD repeat-containing protein
MKNGLAWPRAASLYTSFLLLASLPNVGFAQLATQVVPESYFNDQLSHDVNTHPPGWTWHAICLGTSISRSTAADQGFYIWGLDIPSYWRQTVNEAISLVLEKCTPTPDFIMEHGLNQLLTIPVGENGGPMPVYVRVNGGGDASKDVGPSMCSYHHDPIHDTTGNLALIENDVASRVPFTRYYNSLASFGGLLPAGWSHSYSQRLILTSNSASAVRPSSEHVNFIKTNGAWVNADTDFNYSLIANTDGTWLIKIHNGTIEKYDAAGGLLNIYQANGSSLSASNQAGGLIVQDQFGRGLSLTKNSAGYLGGIADLKGNALANYTFGSNANVYALAAVVYPNPVGDQQRQYLYENTNFKSSMTGIIDEKNAALNTGVRYASWTVDVNGKTSASVNAGGVGGGNTVRLSDSSVAITDPLGTVRNINYVFINGHALMASSGQPAGSGCNASTSTVSYDANGNVTQKDDFNGHRICYINDQSRNLELARIEGLTGQTGANASATPTACSSVTNNGATLPDGGRKVSTQWHPNWTLKASQAEPLLLTTWVYNGQPDPFNGGQVASCVSPMYGTASVPTLPDGSPITVLCKKVEQATTDINGSQGFAATLASNASGSATQRQWTYTYNQYGQVLSATDPLLHTTKYAYYPDTSFSGSGLSAQGHQMGDLLSVTNAVGHITQFTAYDLAGHVLSSTEPTGLVNVYSYTPRGWLSTVKQCAVAPCDLTASSSGLLTSYDYWPTGLLKQVNFPDGAFLSYAYDDAHRLTGISDAAGNTVTYSLDNMGNRIGEQLKDRSGVLARNITRGYDALNRLQSVTGAAQ